MCKYNAHSTLTEPAFKQGDELIQIKRSDANLKLRSNRKNLTPQKGELSPISKLRSNAIHHKHSLRDLKIEIIKPNDKKRYSDTKHPKVLTKATIIDVLSLKAESKGDVDFKGSEAKLSIKLQRSENKQRSKEPVPTKVEVQVHHKSASKFSPVKSAPIENRPKIQAINPTTDPSLLKAKTKLKKEALKDSNTVLNPYFQYQPGKLKAVRPTTNDSTETQIFAFERKESEKEYFHITPATPISPFPLPESKSPKRTVHLHPIIHLIRTDGMKHSLKSQMGKGHSKNRSIKSMKTRIISIFSKASN